MLVQIQCIICTNTIMNNHLYVHVYTCTTPQCTRHKHTPLFFYIIIMYVTVSLVLKLSNDLNGLENIPTIQKPQRLRCTCTYMTWYHRFFSMCTVYIYTCMVHVKLSYHNYQDGILPVPPAIKFLCVLYCRWYW